MKSYVIFSVLGILVTIFSFFLFRSSTNKKNKDSINIIEEKVECVEENSIVQSFENDKKNLLKETENKNFENTTLRFIFKRERKDEILQVQDKKNVYEINLKKMTCTCDDFKKNRTIFENDDARRACKHIRDKLKIKRLLSEHDDLTECVVAYGKVKKHAVKAFMHSGEAVLICYDESEWVDVYARNRKNGETGGKYTGRYDKHKFNKLENCWSWRTGPPGAREIRELIKQVVP